MNANIARADTRTKKASKLRVAAASVLAAIGLSILGSLAPAVASAKLTHLLECGRRFPDGECKKLILKWNTD